METIRNIIDELRQYGDRPPPRFAWNEIATRLETAYQSQLTVGTLCTMACEENGELLAQSMENEKRLAKENARLKAALKMTANAMCDYCRATPEAKGLPCMNGCYTLEVAKAVMAAKKEGENDGQAR